MAVPTYVSRSSAAGSGNQTPALPSGTTDDDILLLAAESWYDVLPTVDTGDWTLIGAPTSGSGDAWTRCQLWWQRYDSGDAPSRQVTGTDHLVTSIVAIRGCETNGSPIHKSVTSTDDGIDSTHSVLNAGGNVFTTTVADCLCFMFAGHGDDLGGAGFNTPANTALTGVTGSGAYWNRTTSGSDGELVYIYGSKATAGGCGAFTWDSGTSEHNAAVVVALMEPQVGPKPAQAVIIG